MLTETVLAPAVDFTPIRRKDLIVHELDGEALVYDRFLTNTHRLNSTALYIWQQCDGRHNLRDIAKRLSEVYEVTMEDAREHVDRMVNEFSARRLLLLRRHATMVLEHDSSK